MNEEDIQRLEGEIEVTVHNLVALAVAARHAHKRDAAPRKTKTRRYLTRTWKEVVSASATSMNEKAEPPPSEGSKTRG